MTELHHIDICIDCLTLLANGEVWNEHGEDITTEHSALVDIQLGDADVTLGHDFEQCEYCAEAWENETNTPCDEGWFSWSSCDGCGSELGGTRYPATLRLEEKSDVQDQKER